MIASTRMIRKLKWMPGMLGGRLADEERDAGAVRGVGPERGSEVRGDVRTDREERHVPQVEQPGEAHDDVQAQRHDHVGRRQDHVVHRAAALAEEERQDGGEAEGRRRRTRPALFEAARGRSRAERDRGCARQRERRAPARRSSRRGAAAPVVRAVLRPIAADRHRAPRRRSVLRAVEERVPALATALHARPLTGELRLVEDAEERRHGTVDAATRGFEGGSPRVVDGDA